MDQCSGVDLKVLHFYKTFSENQFGGGESFIRHLTHATTQLGCENTVLSLSTCPDPPLQTAHYRHVQAKENLSIASTSFSVSVFSTFAKLAAQADLVHYHFPWPFMDVVHFITRTGKPSVVTYHSDIVRQKNLLRIYQPLMHRFLDSVDVIAATSPNYVASSPVLQRNLHKTQAIAIGLEEALYPKANPEAVSALHQRFGARFFLFVGVLRYYKGLQYLLDACVHSPWPLVIVGAGPVEHELKQQALRLNLNNIHFIGQTDDQNKADLLAACYAMVFPSHLRSEAFGISLLEGAMFAKPMVCSEIGTGTSYVNQHHVTGLVVPPADSNALKNALQQLWDNPALAAQYGMAARQRYLNLFTAQNMGRAYTEIYKNLL